MCRAVTTFLLAQRTIFEGPSRYLENVHKAHRIFCGGLWKKFHLKNEIFSEYSNPIVSFIFSKSYVFHFCWHLIWLVCRAITIFYWLKKLSKLICFRDIENVREVNSKFSRSLGKRIFTLKKWDFLRIFKFLKDSSDYFRIFFCKKKVL